MIVGHPPWWTLRTLGRWGSEPRGSTGALPDGGHLDAGATWMVAGYLHDGVNCGFLQILLRGLLDQGGGHETESSKQMMGVGAGGDAG